MSTARTKFTLEAAFKTSELSPDEQSHLVRVYSVMVAGSISAALTSSHVLLTTPTIAHPGYLWFESLFGMLVVVIWFFCESRDNHIRRFVLLNLFCAGMALNFLALINLLYEFDPTVIVTAFVLIPVVFVGFAVTALLTARRSALFLGGLLSSVLLIVLTLNVIASVEGKSTLGEITPYCFLVYLFLTVVFNTQATTEKLGNGEDSVLENALAFISNFLNIVGTVIFMLLKHAYLLARGGSKSEEYEPIV